MIDGVFKHFSGGYEKAIDQRAMIKPHYQSKAQPIANEDYFIKDHFD